MVCPAPTLQPAPKRGERCYSPRLQVLWRVLVVFGGPPASGYNAGLGLCPSPGDRGMCADAAVMSLVRCEGPCLALGQWACRCSCMPGLMYWQVFSLVFFLVLCRYGLAVRLPKQARLRCGGARRGDAALGQRVLCGGVPGTDVRCWGRVYRVCQSGKWVCKQRVQGGAVSAALQILCTDFHQPLLLSHWRPGKHSQTTHQHPGNFPTADQPSGTRPGRSFW